jgi:UDP-glucuronate 4-epimerase
MADTILVTGGAGFIGCHLIQKLLDQGHEVICIDNLNKYYDPKLKQARLDLFRDRITFYKTDISDKEELEKIFSRHKIDSICHLAAQPGVRYSLENPFIYADSNYVGTLNILELAKQNQIKDIVFASTSSVYGTNTQMPFTEDQKVATPISIYSASKRACELLAHAYCHLFGMNITCLRFFTVYGPWGRPDMAIFKFTKNISQGNPIDVYNNGDMERDFTYVSDIVDGFILAMENTGGFKIYNLGRGSPVKLMDFIRCIEQGLKKKAEMNMLPMQPGDVKSTFADITRAREELGYSPKIDINEGVQKFINWYSRWGLE